MSKIKDPVCGMTVNKSEAEKKLLFSWKSGKKYYFCSQKCKDKFVEGEKWYQSRKFGKIFPWVLGLILIVGSFASFYYDFMTLYMGIFLVLFSLMKMFDWKGFVMAFRRYDLLAKHVKLYGWVYPALEFILGIVLLFGIYLEIISWLVLVIFGVGVFSVGIKLLKKERFQCACLGTKINVPLTKVTLLENLIMVVMALLLIGII